MLKPYISLCWNFIFLYVDTLHFYLCWNLTFLNVVIWHVFMLTLTVFYFTTLQFFMSIYLLQMRKTQSWTAVLHFPTWQSSHKDVYANMIWYSFSDVKHNLWRANVNVFVVCRNIICQHLYLWNWIRSIRKLPLKFSRKYGSIWN